MLDMLREQAVQLLAEALVCTLATTGPAGIQASTVRCVGRGTNLYVLVPNTSDHLFNLESEAEVAVTTQSWYLRGNAGVVGDETGLFPAQQSQWHIVVRIVPIRLDILPTSGTAQNAVTIDFDPELG
jgi:hypothetical protein